jgi:ABC-type arginine transport system permease subunit
MTKNKWEPWIGTPSLAWCFGLVYASYLNEHLKGSISGVHRAVLVIGVMCGVYAALSFVGAAVAKRLSQKNSARRS